MYVSSPHKGPPRLMIDGASAQYETMHLSNCKSAVILIGMKSAHRHIAVKMWWLAVTHHRRRGMNAHTDIKHLEAKLDES